MNYRAVAGLLLVVSLLPVAGCDKATPVAPAGTILTISANPSQVALNGRSTITVVGRKPDGNPLNPGTEVRLTAERGTIDSIVTTDSNGTATATFRADGRAGAVKVSAATGGGDAKAETSVQVGQSTDQKPTVLVSVTPSTIGLNGTATVTVIARNSDGSPVAAGTRVNLTTTLGSLSPTNPTVQGNSGTATSTLSAGNREGMATVTAVVGSSDAATTMVSIVLDAATAISVTANPASIPSDKTSTITVTATVTDARAQPVEGALVTFQTEIGKFNDNSSVTTDEKGEARKTLTVNPSDIPSATTTSFKVTVKTPSSTGSTFLENSTDIRIVHPTVSSIRR
jgi:hypothetical protein